MRMWNLGVLLVGAWFALLPTEEVAAQSECGVACDSCAGMGTPFRKEGSSPMSFGRWHIQCNFSTSCTDCSGGGFPEPESQGDGSIPAADIADAIHVLEANEMVALVAAYRDRLVLNAEAGVVGVLGPTCTAHGYSIAKVVFVDGLKGEKLSELGLADLSAYMESESAAIRVATD